MSRSLGPTASLPILLPGAREPTEIPLTLPRGGGIYRFCPGGFHYRLEHSTGYLTTGETQDFSSPPGRSPFGLHPKQLCTLSGDVLNTGPKVKIWAIEYSDKKRLHHANLVLGEGPFSLRWTTHADHRHLVIAVELAGDGTLHLQDLRLALDAGRAVRPAGGAFDFRAPVSPEAARGEPYTLRTPGKPG